MQMMKLVCIIILFMSKEKSYRGTITISTTIPNSNTAGPSIIIVTIARNIIPTNQEKMPFTGMLMHVCWYMIQREYS